LNAGVIGGDRCGGFCGKFGRRRRHEGSELFERTMGCGVRKGGRDWGDEWKEVMRGGDGG
jgi:hypothetical protein